MFEEKNYETNNNAPFTTVTAQGLLVNCNTNQQISIFSNFSTLVLL